MIREHYNERTPSGAASWDIIFFDENNNPIDESNATWCRIHEYNENGVLLRDHILIYRDGDCG